MPGNGERISKLTIRPLTRDLWPALAQLFGKHGACNGCWCMYWRIGSEYKREREKNRAAFRRIVKRGPPGLIAFDGEIPVGWCQLTPRKDLHWLDHWRVFEAVDDSPVWSVSCFYVKPGYRRKGVMTALITEALMAAKRAGAPAVEAYPVDTRKPTSASNLFTGVASTFARAGFKTVARRRPHRPVMRYDLKRVTGK